MRRLQILLTHIPHLKVDMRHKHEQITSLHQLLLLDYVKVVSAYWLPSKELFEFRALGHLNVQMDYTATRLGSTAGRVNTKCGEIVVESLKKKLGQCPGDIQK